MGNTVCHTGMQLEENLSSQEELKRSPTQIRFSSQTCSISDQWRSDKAEREIEARCSPRVTQFEISSEDRQPEIREQSVVVVNPPDQSIDRSPAPRHQTILSDKRQTGEHRKLTSETDDEKLLSLCLLAMNLEALEDDDTVHERHVIPPANFFLGSWEYAGKSTKRSMEIEEIGSLNLDFSQERPRLTVRDAAAGVSQVGYLKPAGEGSSRRTEVARLQYTVEQMAKVIRMLSSQIGVLEERVRFVETADTVTMKE